MEFFRRQKPPPSTQELLNLERDRQIAKEEERNKIWDPYRAQLQRQAAGQRELTLEEKRREALFNPDEAKKPVDVSEEYQKRIKECQATDRDQVLSYADRTYGIRGQPMQVRLYESEEIHERQKLKGPVNRTRDEMMEESIEFLENKTSWGRIRKLKKLVGG